MSTLIIGVDVAATQFELALANDRFELQERRRLNRAQFVQFSRELSPCLILMEACSSAHFWARALQALGHQVRLLPAQYVRPYVRRNKTDAADAAALLEAVRCSELRPVPVKTVDQQSVLQLHRLREQYKLTRNARLNFLRAAVQELGVLIPTGLRKSLSALQVVIDSPPTEWPASLVKMYAHVLAEIEGLRKGMIAVEKGLRLVTHRDRVVRDLQTICGIGPLTATALRAAVGDIARFPSGRHFACWLGLTAREYSSGELRRMGRISRRGDRHLRTLLVNGARSALIAANRFPTPGGRPLDALRTWALRVQQRSGLNKATVALANKLARVIWATWHHQRPFDGNWGQRINAQ